MTQRACVTGGGGFFGSHVVGALRHEGWEVAVPRRKDCDLSFLANAERAFAGMDLIVHCAAYNGGLGLHSRAPADIYYENLMLHANVMEGMRRAGVAKGVMIGSACAYPDGITRAMKEDDLWTGFPHESVLGFGLIKRMNDIAVRIYRRQYGLKVIHLVYTNLYGPRDVFDPGRSHVVGALIKKFVEAKRAKAPRCEVWGSGDARRDLLYVEDGAKAVLAAASRYDGLDPVNVATGVPVTIRELAEAIRLASRYEGEIFFDATKPDGQMTKYLDPSRAKEKFGWAPTTSLVEGVTKTVRWYEETF